MKGRFIHPTKRIESGFSETPEALDTIDMRVASGKLIAPMINSKMLFVPKINEAVIAPPTVTMDDTFRSYASSDNRLQCGSTAIWDDFSVNFTVPFKDAENYGFATCASASAALDPASTEVAFIDLNFSSKG